MLSLPLKSQFLLFLRVPCNCAALLLHLAFVHMFVEVMEELVAELQISRVWAVLVVTLELLQRPFEQTVLIDLVKQKWVRFAIDDLELLVMECLLLFPKERMYSMFQQKV